MISKQLSETLGFSVREAKKRRHEYVSIEHLLFAILFDSDGAEIIENSGGSVDNLKNALETFFNERMESLPDGDEYVLQQTVGFQRVIQRAINQVRSAEKQEVSVSDMLASIFLEKDSHAEYFLRSEGVTRMDILNYLAHHISKVPFRKDSDRSTKTDQEEKKRKE